MSETLLFQLDKVTYHYQNEGRSALQEMSFSIRKGEWIWIVGPGGAGKTTLCRLLSGVLQTWGGIIEGTAHFQGENLLEKATQHLAGQVGIIFQDPDMSFLLEYVADELAFGPENLLVPTEEIEKRIDQALISIDLLEYKNRRINQLSGGQKQRVAIASVFTMQPKIFIFDDAMVNLDSNARKHFLATLHALYKQGHTIITASARFDDEVPFDQLIVLDQGKQILVEQGNLLRPPVIDMLKDLGCFPPDHHSFMVERERKEQGKRSLPSASSSSSPLLEVQNLCFEYRTKQRDEGHVVLENLQLQLYEYDFLALLGPNGSGKTTFGKLLAGFLPSPKGSIRLHGREINEYSIEGLSQTVGYVFQNPEHQFVADTVLEECIFGLFVQHGIPLHHLKDIHLKGVHASKQKQLHTIEHIIRQGEEWLRKTGLYAQRHRHPLQLSVAEKQLLNLTSVLILQPDLIVLDEPTAGLDYKAANQLMSYCADYAQQGHGVIMITHDLPLINQWATRKINF